MPHTARMVPRGVCVWERVTDDPLVWKMYAILGCCGQSVAVVSIALVGTGTTSVVRKKRAQYIRQFPFAARTGRLLAATERPSRGFAVHFHGNIFEFSIE